MFKVIITKFSKEYCSIFDNDDDTNTYFFLPVRVARIGHKTKNNTVGLTPLPYFMRLPHNNDDDEYE